MFTLDQLPDLENPEAEYRHLNTVEEGEVNDVSLEPLSETRTDIFTGLENSVWSPSDSIFVTDHHNKAIAPWLAASNQWEEDSLLMHLDLHRDAEPILENLDNFEKLYEQNNIIECVNKAGISEIVWIAEELELFDEVYSWGHVNLEGDRIKNSLKELNPPIDQYERILLDFDLDFFEGLEMYPPDHGFDIIDYYSSFSELQEKADLTTYATSPGYISQESAVEHLVNIQEYVN